MDDELEEPNSEPYEHRICIPLSESLEINEASAKILKRWFDDHYPYCPHQIAMEAASHDGNYDRKYCRGSAHWIFTPTSIGMRIDYVCPCGDKINISDYGKW